MKNLKIILSILVFIFSTNSTSAKTLENEVGILPSLFGIIKSVERYIVDMNKEEKAKEIFDELNYFNSDLERYLTLRKQLMDVLASNNYSIRDDKAKKILSKLKPALNKLRSDQKKIKSLIKTSIPGSAKQIQSDESSFQQQTYILDVLEAFMKGKSTDIPKLKSALETIYNDLKNVLENSIDVRTKIGKKYDLI